MKRLYDIRPFLSADIEFIKYYRKKNSKELHLSKKPIVKENIDRCSTCRELFISGLDRTINNEIYNNKFVNNPYILSPKAYVEGKRKKKYILNTSIGLTTNGINQYMELSKYPDLVIKTLDYIVGIISVCLSRGEEEIQRRKLGKGKAGSCYIDYNENTLDIKYNVLSPFWLTSPILTSFILGITRNCLALIYCLGSKDLNEFLFSKIEYNEIKSIINNVDYKKAQEVYYNIIEPFFDLNGIRNTKGIYLSFKDKRDVLKKLIDDGYESVFRPERMKQHWKRYSEFYGFDRFCSYINSDYAKLKYENYRRV